MLPHLVSHSASLNDIFSVLYDVDDDNDDDDNDDDDDDDDDDKMQVHT